MVTIAARPNFRDNGSDKSHSREAIASPLLKTFWNRTCYYNIHNSLPCYFLTNIMYLPEILSSEICANL